MKYVSICIEVFKGLTIMEIPDEMLKEIRESGYDQELVYNYIRELLNIPTNPCAEIGFPLGLIAKKSSVTFGIRKEESSLVA